MRALLSWLREFAPEIDGDPEWLSDKLSGLGLTVESMTVTGEIAEGVVLARVLELRPHPDADRIQLVHVDDGSGEPLQVCCGAFNMVPGNLVPLARVGTVMPGGLEITRRRIRGQDSAGMCCSAAELGLDVDADVYADGDADGIAILDERARAAAQPGMPLADALGLEVDILWDLEVNANRPDAMSVIGVARDLAAGLGVSFAPPDWPPVAAGAGLAVGELASVEIVDPGLCGRFCTWVLHDVAIGPSPPWLTRRLMALGMRPVNSIVDISNYVMLELGQPSHTFDMTALPGGRLRVRRATAGERIVTLDGVERVLAAGDGVITDGADTPISIAGVMGGQSSEISSSTSDVLLEMAWWDPPSISRTVKRLNLPSEAATRFRRGTDWGENMERAGRRFAQLATSLGASLAPGRLDERGELPGRSPLRVRRARINGLLGTDLTAEVMGDRLRSIGFEVSAPADGRDTGDLAMDAPDASDDLVSDDLVSDDLLVTIPTWRWDTSTETDIAEEVARLHGYENITRTVPTGSTAGGLSPYQRDRRLVREVLVGAGCDETQPMPFLARGDTAEAGLSEVGITLTNPIDDGHCVLRTSLLPGQLKAIAYNQHHFNPDVRFFEIGHVFLPPPDGDLLPEEPEMLAVALASSAAPAAVEILANLEDALALPNPVLRSEVVPGLHPTRSALVLVAGRVRGEVGEVDPAVTEAFDVTGRVAWLQLDLGAVLDGPHGNRVYRPVSKYPPSDIDLAFVAADDVAAASVEATVRKAAGPLLVDLRLFDVYRGVGVAGGSRSLAYRLRFQATDRTLTADDVASVRAACILAVADRCGAVLRA